MSSVQPAKESKKKGADEFIVAIVPAKNRADSIGSTVSALINVALVDLVIVVDDGSGDETSARVAEMQLRYATKLELVVLATNVGKGGAVTAGVAASPQATIYLLIDADLGDTADIAAELLAPVLDGSAEMTIGVPSIPAGKRGGFGLVRGLSAWGIYRATKFLARAPLSGQRAVRAELLRSVTLADRFGLETGLTIDARLLGRTVSEVPVSFEHRHTGRSLVGFSHRARQGGDIIRSLWSRLTTSRMRSALMICIAAILTLGAIATASQWEPTHVTGATGAKRVVLFGFPRLSLDDLGTGAVPGVDALVAEGAFGATSVRTVGGRPTSVEAYASIGAGNRVRVKDSAADGYLARDVIGVVTAAELAKVRTGVTVDGSIVVTGMAETIATNAKRFLSSAPGALGEALRAAGNRAAVVNVSDTGLLGEDPAAGLQRPAVIAVADRGGNVHSGMVGRSLLRADPTAPTGATIDQKKFLAAADAAINDASVIVLDPGEMDRTFSVKAISDPAQFERLRLRALRITDALLTNVRASLPRDVLLMVVSVRPPTGTWELTPTVLVGAGIKHGYLHSPSTQRLGLVTLTDLAPTILDAIGLPVAEGMIGHPLEVHLLRGATDIGKMKNLSALATYRERIYLPLTKGYVIFQAIIYLLTIVLFSARGGVGRLRSFLGWIALAIAAWPLATFVFRIIPHAWALGPFGGVVMLGIDIVLVTFVGRFRRHPLSPLSWLLFGTVAINVIDLWTGAHLQQSSILGYSPHTAARFTGIGNAAFAALASTTILWAGIHVNYAPRRKEAVLAAGLVCATVMIADGAPMLGSDVGGILTLVPIFGLLIAVLSGRTLNKRLLAIAAGSTAVIVALATALDLTRPADQQTHLGRFVTDIRSGRSNTFVTTIGRKLSTNIRVFTGSFWTWVVPIIAVVLLFFLVVERGWERDMPRGSALRACVAAALLCGLLGFAVNDSGTVVTALVFVYLGPFIILLALQRDRLERTGAKPTVAEPGSSTT